MTNQSVLIIGSGISGLVCAILLSRAGYSVTVSEKSPTTAPVIRGFKRRGLYYDTGIHEIGAIGRGEILDKYLAHLNCPLEYTYFNSHAIEKIRFATDGSEYKIPSDPNKFLTQLATSFPEEAGNIASIINDMQSIYLSAPFISLKNLDSFSFGSYCSDMTLKAYLDSKLKNEKLKMIFSARYLLLGTPPERVSFQSYSMLFASYFSTTGNFKNGGVDLAENLEKEARNWGANIITGNGVKRVTRENDGSFLTTLENDDRIKTDNLIFSIHRSKMTDILDADIIGERYTTYLKKLKETLTGEIYFAASKRDRSKEEPSIEYIFDLENTFYTSFGQKQKNGFEPVTIITPSDINKFDKWKDTFTHKRGKEYLNFKKENYDKIISRLSSLYPEYSSIEYVDSASPLTVRDYLNNKGSLYGTSHEADGIMPSPRLRAKGVYITGQGLVAQGVLGAILSGYFTSSFFTGYDNLINEIKNTVIL